jgi:hypothetical protein
MFDSVQLKTHKKEISVARVNRKSRADFGSILRRNIKTFYCMPKESQILWLNNMDLPCPTLLKSGRK